MSFPHDDTAWAATAEFLRGRLGPADRLLAPDPFRWVIPRAQRFRQAAEAAPADFEWIATHKGELAEIPRDFLAALPGGATPVFANEVFVVWAPTPPADLPSLAEADHVRAFHANLAALPPAPPAPLPAPPGRVTTVRLPGDEPGDAPPALPPRPLPRPRHDPRDAAPRPWLSPGGLPGVMRERAFQEELDRLVADSLGPATGEALLDIGCGGGRLGTLFGAAAQVTGIDIDDAALARARTRHAMLPHFAFARMDAAQLGFADASFDAAVILDSLEAFAEPALALAEAARVLARGGRLMVTATNRESLPLRALRRLALPMPKRGFSVQELTGMLRAVGLHVIRSDGLLLSPGWALPGIGGAMGPLEEDPEFVEAARLLGRRAGPDYAMAFSLVARKG
ncbi:class I SAM-dependent methyltransferase [Falsiroseomonas sp. CW058]|uniref:class I SAM-dependent methyltransferase n=1 Tax=Falsiroseomonas sp. CW058 TaxID=3388664 RepID=UPI003D31EBC4